MTNSNKTAIYVTNLGKYNEGMLVGEWLPLPADADEIAACLDRIGINEYYEEYFITDYDDYTDFDLYDIFGEYSQIEIISDFVETVESLEDYEQEIMAAFMNEGYDSEEALEKTKDGDYMLFYDCHSMAEVAEQYCEECGVLDQMPDHLRYYFDFEAYGRDMSFEGHFVEIESGYIEIF